MVKWYRFSRCATAFAVAAAASASPTLADEPLTLINHDDCSTQQYADYFACPPPIACPPDFGPSERIISPDASALAPIEIPESSTEVVEAPAAPGASADPAMEATAEPTPFSESFEAPLAEPVTEPTPLDFGNFSQPSGGVGFASSSSVAAAPAPGYIDFAPVQTRFRIRYDNAVGANDPTRGEFLYPSPSANLGPNANGPPLLGAGLGDVEFEELSFYFEYALFERFSVFIDAPIRWVSNVDFDGDSSADTQGGFGDLRTGFKLGLIDNRDTHVTTQFLVSTPTGDAREALGTGNVAFDIGLLFDHRINDDVIIFGEFRDWFTLNAPTVAANTGDVDLSANILRIGTGVGVDLLEFGDCRCRPKTITGIFEVVGWTVLDGFSTDINGSNLVDDAQGDTIVNGKYGLRYQSGKHTGYVGYGHNWSGNRWYSDLVRIEYGINF